MNHLAARRRLLVAESEIHRAQLARDLCDFSTQAEGIRSRGRVAFSVAMGAMAWRGISAVISNVRRPPSPRTRLVRSVWGLVRAAVGLWVTASTVRKASRMRGL